MNKNENKKCQMSSDKYVDFDDVLGFSKTAVSTVKAEEKIIAEIYQEEEDDFKLWRD